MFSAADGLKSSSADADRENVGVSAGRKLLPVEGGCTISIRIRIRQDGPLTLLPSTCL